MLSSGPLESLGPQAIAYLCLLVSPPLLKLLKFHIFFVEEITTVWDVTTEIMTHFSFQTGSRCFLMSSRIESSHIQKLKGFPGMFSLKRRHYIEKFRQFLFYLFFLGGGVVSRALWSGIRNLRIFAIKVSFLSEYVLLRYWKKSLHFSSMLFLNPPTLLMWLAKGEISDSNIWRF